MQAELLKKQRELDDARRELDLTIEKRLSEGAAEIQKKARQAAEDQLRLKVSEKDQVIISMQRQLEELRRKSEQGSQQLQGEVLELEMESILAARFARDTIEPVPKGEHGGDILHRVTGPLGLACGTILWESKVITRQWAKRAEQIERVMQSTVGLYGDLQGIAGQTVLEIEGLSLDALAVPALE